MKKAFVQARNQFSDEDDANWVELRLQQLEIEDPTLKESHAEDLLQAKFSEANFKEYNQLKMHRMVTQKIAQQNEGKPMNPADEAEFEKMLAYLLSHEDTSQEAFVIQDGQESSGKDDVAFHLDRLRYCIFERRMKGNLLEEDHRSEMNDLCKKLLYSHLYEKRLRGEPATEGCASEQSENLLSRVCTAPTQCMMRDPDNGSMYCWSYLQALHNRVEQGEIELDFTRNGQSYVLWALKPTEDMAEDWQQLLCIIEATMPLGEDEFLRLQSSMLESLEETGKVEAEVNTAEKNKLKDAVSSFFESEWPSNQDEMLVERMKQVGKSTDVGDRCERSQHLGYQCLQQWPWNKNFRRWRSERLRDRLLQHLGQQIDAKRNERKLLREDVEGRWKLLRESMKAANAKQAVVVPSQLQDLHIAESQLGIVPETNQFAPAQGEGEDRDQINLEIAPEVEQIDQIGKVIESIDMHELSQNPDSTERANDDSILIGVTKSGQMDTEHGLQGNAPGTQVAEVEEDLSIDKDKE